MTDAPIVQVSEAGIIYRASALGGCRRALLAARQGLPAKPPPPDFSNPEGTGYFDLGHEAEDFIVDRLIEQGWKVHHREQEVVLTFPSLPNVRVAGHIDGLGEPGSILPGPPGTFTHLLEMKNFGQSFYDRWKRGGFAEFPNYAIQVSTYQYALQIPDLCMVVHNHDTGEFDISFHEAPPRQLWEIETLVTATEELFKLNPPLSTVDCTKNYPCPYYELHDLATPLDSTNLMFARALDLFDEKIKTLEQQKEAFKEKLRALEVGSYEGVNDRGEYVKVSVGDGTSERINTTKVRELLAKAKVDVSKYIKTTQGKKRITVTVRGPKRPDAP